MDSRQIKKTDDRLQKLSTAQKRNNTKYSKTKPPWFSGLLPHAASQETRWAYSTAPEPTRSGYALKTNKESCHKMTSDSCTISLV